MNLIKYFPKTILPSCIFLVLMVLCLKFNLVSARGKRMWATAINILSEPWQTQSLELHFLLFWRK